MSEGTRIFLDGPTHVRKWGPVEIDYQNYVGFYFFLFGRDVYPRRFSPLWIIARMMYPDILGRRKK